MRVLLHCIHDDDKPFRSDVATTETVECMESVSSHVPVSAGMVIRPKGVEEEEEIDHVAVV